MAAGPWARLPDCAVSGTAPGSSAHPVLNLSPAPAPRREGRV